MTPSDLTTGQRSDRQAGGRPGRILPALILVVACGGGPVETTPGVAGEAIPDPPDQGAPWMPPATKLPRSFVDATAVLFDSGVADPRGCEYREVEVAGRRGVYKSRGFVMPERPGVAGRFVVGWDGMVRPARSVGAKADLEADVRELAVLLRKLRDSPKFRERTTTNVTKGTTTKRREKISPFRDERGPATVAPRSPLTLSMLLRLGRADLAETLYAAATDWSPEDARPDLADEDIGFASLSRGWSDALYSRLIEAHCGGDGVDALDAARRLDHVRMAFEAKAGAPGFRREGPRRGLELEPVYVRNADVITELLADQQRRAREAPRGPIPPRGGDPTARIAALIRDFDRIHVQQQVTWGGADPGDGAIVGEVVAEGDQAVEPLLAALESDTRLTRCIFSRAGRDRTRPVLEAVYAALQRLLKTERFMDDMSDFAEMKTLEGRKRLAGAARALWEKNRAVPMAERWYRTLADHSAGPARWLEAATGLVQPPGRGMPAMGYFTVRKSGPPHPEAMAGEKLRKLGRPSVSELLARRCKEIAGTGKAPTIPDVNLLRACDLALRFTWWDEAGSLPTIKALMTTCRERSLDPEQVSQSGAYARYIAEFTIVRARAGDRQALDEYAAWVRAIDPGTIDLTWRRVLEPMRTYPDHKAIAEAARVMFLNPKSPWLPLVPAEERPALR